MVKSDHGLDAGIAQRADHLAIPVQSGLIDLAFAWLDARPLDGHPMRAEA